MDDEGRVCRADPDNLPSGERGKMTHFQGCDHFSFPPEMRNDVHGLEEQSAVPRGCESSPPLQPGHTAVMYSLLVTASS